MTSQTDLTTAAVQAAHEHRLTEAEALNFWHQQALLAGQSPKRLGSEYLRRGRAIDAAYEQQVEPLRQQFLESNSDRALPPFLAPGFQALIPGKPGKLGKKKIRGPLTDTQWTLIISAAVILVATILLASIATSGFRSSRTTPAAKPVASLTNCETAMRTASREPDSTLAEPLIMATTQACGSKAAWIAAVKKFPGAMGMMDYTDAQARQSWELVCYDVPTAPACRG